MSDTVGGRVTGSDAEGPVTMPEGTGVGVAHQGSVPQIPVNGCETAAALLSHETSEG